MSSKRRFKMYGKWVNHREWRGMIRRGRNAAKWFQIGWALSHGGGMNRKIKNYLRGAGAVVQGGAV